MVIVDCLTALSASNRTTRLKQNNKLGGRESEEHYLTFIEYYSRLLQNKQYARAHGIIRERAYAGLLNKFQRIETTQNIISEHRGMILEIS